ncbi:hypothetical protein CAEBREN_19992 [Caenorhabditis brenneri]|uniref:Uncharacterized protein n=1 Tax=Caenorhabditis brenneri TaxID=135651 RepID=G0MBL6_CAEBE|nr:hypothetical protein CAEBREN_19992 [Caenorhabditis brenneri]
MSSTAPTSIEQWSRSRPSEDEVDVDELKAVSQFIKETHDDHLRAINDDFDRIMDLIDEGEEKLSEIAPTISDINHDTKRLIMIHKRRMRNRVRALGKAAVRKDVAQKARLAGVSSEIPPSSHLKLNTLRQQQPTRNSAKASRKPFVNKKLPICQPAPKEPSPRKSVFDRLSKAEHNSEYVVDEPIIIVEKTVTRYEPVEFNPNATSNVSPKQNTQPTTTANSLETGKQCKANAAEIVHRSITTDSKTREKVEDKAAMPRSQRRPPEKDERCSDKKRLSPEKKDRRQSPDELSRNKSDRNGKRETSRRRQSHQRRFERIKSRSRSRGVRRPYSPVRRFSPRRQYHYKPYPSSRRSPAKRDGYRYGTYRRSSQQRFRSRSKDTAPYSSKAKCDAERQKLQQADSPKRRKESESPTPRINRKERGRSRTRKSALTPTNACKAKEPAPEQRQLQHKRVREETSSPRRQQSKSPSPKRSRFRRDSSSSSSSSSSGSTSESSASSSVNSGASTPTKASNTPAEPVELPDTTTLSEQVQEQQQKVMAEQVVEQQQPESAEAPPKKERIVIKFDEETKRKAKMNPPVRIFRPPRPQLVFKTKQQYEAEQAAIAEATQSICQGTNSELTSQKDQSLLQDTNWEVFGKMSDEAKEMFLNQKQKLEAEAKAVQEDKEEDVGMEKEEEESESDNDDDASERETDEVTSDDE